MRYVGEEVAAVAAIDPDIAAEALDLIDETAAYTKTLNTKTRNIRVVKKIETELRRLEEEKTKAVMLQDFTTALHLKSQEDKLIKQRSEYQKTLGKRAFNN